MRHLLGLLRRTQPPLGPPFFVKPGAGNDSNDGLTNATAWATWGKLVASLASLPQGDWVDLGNRPAGYATIAGNLVRQDAWNAAYLVGNRVHTGARIIIDTSVAALPVTAQLVLGKRALIHSGANGLVVNLTLPVQVFTQPNAGSFPNVWKTANAYPLAMLYEGGAQLKPMGGNGSGFATLALAMAAMTAGSFYVDPADNKLCFWPIASGNPNVDGVARTYSPSLLGGIDGQLIDITGGLAKGVAASGGALFNGVTGLPVAQELLAVTNGQAITVRDTCTLSYCAGKHSSDNVSNETGGIFVRVRDTMSFGPGGVNTGNWSHDGDYCSQVAAGTSATYYNSCQSVNTWANVGTVGGTDLDPTYGPAPYDIKHNNTGPNSQFQASRSSSGHYRSLYSFGSGETALATSSGDIFDYSFSTEVASNTVTNATINYRFPSLGNANATAGTITGSTFAPSVGFAGNCDLRGTWAITGGSLTQAASGNSSQWVRRAAYALTFSGMTISTQNFQLISALTSATDTLSFVGCTITGASSANPLISSYNGGGAISWATGGANATTGISFTGGCTYNGSLIGSP